MRLLHILSTPRAEGTPNLVLDWASAGTDHWQGIVVLHSRPADLADRLRAASDAYEEHDLYDRGYRKFPDISRVAFKAVRKYRPDVLICWPTGFANWICAGAALAGAKRLLVHCGNPPQHGAKADWMTRYVMWPLAAIGAKCVCCSDYVRGEFESVPGLPKWPFHTVWNCVRGHKMAARAADGRRERTGHSRRAIMVATLELHKDHQTLLHAVPTIVASLPDFELWLVGEGTLRSEIEATICRLEIGDHVKLLGSQSDVGYLLGQSDVFVIATTPQEGLGSVLLEALSTGLPVVASDVPACRELLHGGSFGSLVPPSDPPALAEAIVQALVDRRPANPEARDFALSLGPERMIRAYLALA